MAHYALARFELRADQAAELALHDHASYVRRELPGVMWTAYRDPDAPARYTALVRIEDAKAEAQERAAFAAALGPFLVGEVETTVLELVTSSDLQRRHRR